MNTCHSARYDDFARAAGISGDIYHDPLGTRIYLGWVGDVPAKLNDLDAECYYTFEINWFNRQAMGRPISIKAAALDAMDDLPPYMQEWIGDKIIWNIQYYGAMWEYFYFGQ